MSEPTATRKCYACKEIKPIDEFGASKRNPLGYSYKCKLCIKEYGKSKTAKRAIFRYRKTEKGMASADKAETKESRKKYLAEYRKSDKNKQIQKAYAAKNRHPGRKKARMAIKSAVRAGRMIHPSSLLCEICSDNVGNTTHAEQYHHHKGYAKKHWFDVVPVCVPCHGKIHSHS